MQYIFDVFNNQLLIFVNLSYHIMNVETVFEHEVNIIIKCALYSGAIKHLINELYSLKTGIRV